MLPKAIALASVAASTAFAEPPRYRVDLIDPGSTPVTLHNPVAINDNGMVVGYFGTQAFGDPYGYRTWVAASPTAPAADIGHPANLVTVLPSDISNEGEIVGFAAEDLTRTETQTRTYRWREGSFLLYPQLVAGRPTRPGLMNDSGRLIGSANDGSFNGYFAMEYMPDGTLRRLMPEAPGYNHAIDINNRDEILGTEVRGAFVWTPGEPDRTFLPPPSEIQPILTARALNDRADVVGSARRASHPEGSSAVAWLDRQWRFIPAGGRRNVAVSINNHQEVVGNSQDNTGGLGDHGWRYSPRDGHAPLIDLIDPPGVWGVLLATDINNRGQITAVVMDRATGDTFGAVLTPIRCDADFNRDGFLDFFDYAEFAACFEGACSPGVSADFNQDGFTDFFDYDAFVAAFEAGC